MKGECGGSQSEVIMNGIVIETRSLTRIFGHQYAVKELNLNIARGEIFGLLGPNGAGKSTTIKMLITLLPPSSGTALISGFDIREHPREVRQHIGYVPQSVSVDGALTSAENLKLAAKLYGVEARRCKASIHEALEFMGLESAADTLVRNLSGGTVRRLEIAQAMLHQPDILFLDEPTIGLDPAARHAVWDRLRDLKTRYGTSILLTTHDMDEADHLCDRIGILHQGRLVALGSPAELKAAWGLETTLDEAFLHYTGTAFKSAGPAARAPLPREGVGL